MTNGFPRTVSRTAAALAATAATVAAIAFVNTDTIVENGFASALVPAAGAAVRPVVAASESGSEDYWLGNGRPAGTSPVAWTGPVATVGERISLTTADGRDVTLDVVDVRDLGREGVLDTVTRLEPGGSRSYVVVTCREAGAGSDVPLVRFIVEPNTGVPWRSLGRPAHAL